MKKTRFLFERKKEKRTINRMLEREREREREREDAIEMWKKKRIERERIEDGMREEMEDVMGQLSIV